MSFATTYVNTHPEMMLLTAGELQVVGAAVAAGSTTAAVPTTGVIPAAADPVSALTAMQFAAHGAAYQAISAQAAAVHDLFVSTLQTSAGLYGTTEAANAIATS